MRPAVCPQSIDELSGLAESGSFTLKGKPMEYDKETIKGSTDGYSLGTKFELTNGQVWEQTSDDDEYVHQFMPEVLLDTAEGVGKLKINDMNDWVEVKRIL